MKTRQKILNGNLKSNKSSFLFLFLFLFSLTFLSASWNYGGIEDYIKNSQLDEIGGNFNSGVDLIIGNNGNEYINDVRQQPLIIDNINNEKVIVVQDGAYLRLLDKDLNVLGEKLLSNSPIGHRGLVDWNLDNSDDIFLTQKMNNTALNFSVYEINSDWSLSLIDSLVYSPLSINETMDFYGVKCSLDESNCYGIYQITNTTTNNCSLYVLDIYENSGISIAGYTVDSNVDSSYCSNINEPISFSDINADGREEFLVYTQEKAYVLNGVADLFEIDISTEAEPFSYGGEGNCRIQSSRMLNTIEGWKIAVLYNCFEDGNANVDSFIRTYSNTGARDDSLTEIATVPSFIGMSVYDYSNNGYDDIGVIRYFTSTQSDYFGRYGIPEIYSGRDLSNLYSGSTNINISRTHLYEFDSLLTLGRLTQDERPFFIISSGSGLTLYDTNNNTELYFNNSLTNLNCIVSDVTDSGLNDVYCSDSTSGVLLTPQTDVIGDVPTQIKSFPDVYLGFTSTKNYWLNDYFNDYSRINITALNQTISIELNAGGNSESISNENVTIGLLDYFTDARIGINSKSNNITITDVEIKAINEVGEITDTFDIIISETYIETEFPEEYDNFLTDTAQNVLDLFPDADDLSAGQKIMIIVLVMFIVTAILIFALNTKEGLHTGVLYLAGFVNLMLFIMFIALGYISIGVLIVMALVLMAIAYFKLKGDN